MTKLKREENNGKLELKRKKPFDYKALIFTIALVAIPTIQFIIFYIATNINSFSLAFKYYDLGNFEWIGGFDNFQKVFKDIASTPEVIASLKNSFVVYGVSLLINIPLAILFTFYIYKKYIGHKVFKILLYMPCVLASLTLCMIFRYFTDAALPEIAEKYFDTNMMGFFANSETEYFALMFAFIFFSFGTSMLMYLGAMSSINESVIEAAKIDGVTSFGELIRIVLPMIFPTIKTFLVCGLAGIFANQFNLFSYYGTGANMEYETMGYYFYKMIVTGRINYPYIAAFGIVISLVLIPIALALNKLLEKLDPMAE